MSIIKFISFFRSPLLLIRKALLFSVVMFATGLVLGQETTETFNYTGQVVEWDVPPGVTEVNVKIWGAGGAGGNSSNTKGGGAGSYVYGTIDVSSYSKLYLSVGQGGVRFTNSSSGAGSTSAFGGGGKGANWCGGGGGYSGIFTGPTPTQANTLAIAGGGGGGANVGGYGNEQGRGGNQSSNSGGQSSLVGVNGSSNRGGGGGGGGYNGGSSPGNNNGGKGGTSYGSGLTLVAGGAGSNAGPTGTPIGIAGGGRNSNGNHGRIDITYTIASVDPYVAQITNLDKTTWCEGETANATVKVENIGDNTWAGENVYLVARWNNTGTWIQGPSVPLVDGADGNFSIEMTAPAGATSLAFDLQKDGINFSSNTNGLGPNNVLYTETINVNSLPTADAGDNEMICLGGQVELGEVGLLQGSAMAPLNCNGDSWPGSAYISNVKSEGGVTNFNNTTGNNANSQGNGGPKDYTSTNFVEVIHGNSFDLRITLSGNGNGNYVRVWLDKDNNGSFSATEAVGSFNASGGGTTTQAISIPTNDLEIGSYRILVRCRESSDITAGNACAPESSPDKYGEMEYYKLVVLDPYSYSWSPATNLSATDVSDPTFTPTSTGEFTYELTLTDNATGCTATDEVTVTVADKPVQVGVISGSNLVCVGETITYSIDPVADATEYTWSVPNGWTINSGHNTTSINVTAGTNAISGTIGVYALNDCGNGTGNTISVDVSNTPNPTLSFSPNTNICQGTNVTYTTESGKSNYTWEIPGIEGSDYTLVSGGASTNNTVVIAWNAASAGTSVQVNYEDGGCAASTPATATEITLPNIVTSLAENGESATCYINGENPIHFYSTSSKKYIGSINPNGRTGVVTMTAYVHDFGSNPGIDDGTMYACGGMGNDLYRTAFMERSFVINPVDEISGSGNTDVYLPFTSTEFDNLEVASTSKTVGNAEDDIADVADLVITKYHSPGNENGVPYDNCSGGISSLIEQAESGNISNYGVPIIASYAMFKMSDFSEIYLHGYNNVASPLPIELVSFIVECQKNDIIVNWTTASETNSDIFIVEKSRNGSNWQEVETIDAAGNSTSTINYSITDNDSWNGVSYYRLRQLDFDGQEEVYGPISVSCVDNGNSMIVFPNPSDGNFTVEINSNETIDNATVQLMDYMGRILSNKKVDITTGVNQVYFDNVDLQRGTYIVRLLGGEKEFTPVKAVVN